MRCQTLDVGKSFWNGTQFVQEWKSATEKWGLTKLKSCLQQDKHPVKWRLSPTEWGITLSGYTNNTRRIFRICKEIVHPTLVRTAKTKGEINQAHSKYWGQFWNRKTFLCCWRGWITNWYRYYRNQVLMSDTTWVGDASPSSHRLYKSHSVEHDKSLFCWSG